MYFESKYTELCATPLKLFYSSAYSIVTWEKKNQHAVLQ